jgi:SAM-dependent methyltransferase
MWQRYPVFIINRDRLTTTRRLVEWLLGIGCLNVQILDNDSSYPQLIDWYEHVPSKVAVHRLGENLGPWAFWALKLHTAQDLPYVVTDSDIIPSEFCPNDLIARMTETLAANPGCGKVGASLRVDSLPAHYSRRELAFEWESRLWHQPFYRGLFSAPVDTTFALYPAGGDFDRSTRNIRMGYPYLMEHAPWHVNDSAPDEEELYYRAHASNEFIHWGAAQDDAKIGLIESEVASSSQPTVLHLGCGNEYIPGWINVDVSGRKLDIEFDLNTCRTQRLPVADGAVDGVYICHVLEHVDDVLALMQELHRVCRADAKLFIRMPYGSSDDAWEDPTHRRAWFENSFLYYSQPAYSRADYGYSGDWQCEKVTLVVPHAVLAQGIQEAYRTVKTQRNVVSEMIVELRSIKPARMRLLDELKGGRVVLTSDPRIVPQFETTITPPNSATPLPLISDCIPA